MYTNIFPGCFNVAHGSSIDWSRSVFENTRSKAERGQVRVCPIRDLGFQGAAFAMAGKNLGRQKRYQFVCSLGEYKFLLSFHEVTS